MAGDGTQRAVRVGKVRALVHAWLVLDFFGEARRSGGGGSTLTTTIFSQSFLAFLFAALLFPEVPPVPFAAANLCLSSLLVGIGVLADHEHRQRRRADQVLLGTAPIRRAQLVAARVGHAAFYGGLVTIGMALPPGVLLAFSCRDVWQLPAYVGAACVASALATGLLGVVLRALDRWLGPVRAALAAGTGKALLLGGGLVLFALGLRALDATADALPIGRAGAELLPPYHLAKLLHDPFGQAWRALPLLAAGAVLLALRILLERTDAGDDLRVRAGGPLQRLLRASAGAGPRLGIAEFVATAMWRSPGFRSRVLPLLGLPAGMVFLTLQGDGGPDLVFTSLLLQLPAIYLPFVIAFLPRAEQPDTGWVFAHAPGLGMPLVRDATWRALVTHVLVPVHLGAAALAIPSHRAPLDVAAACVFAFGLAVLASRPMLRSLDVVPFSRGEDSDQATDLGGLFSAAIGLGAAGVLFAVWLPGWARWVAAVVVLGGALVALRRPQATATGPGAPVQEPTEPAAKKSLPMIPPSQEPSLGRELRAIVFLYGAVCVVPTLVGWVFGGS